MLLLLLFFLAFVWLSPSSSSPSCQIRKDRENDNVVVQHRSAMVISVTMNFDDNRDGDGAYRQRRDNMIAITTMTICRFVQASACVHLINGRCP